MFNNNRESPPIDDSREWKTNAKTAQSALTNIGQYLHVAHINIKDDVEYKWDCGMQNSKQQQKIKNPQKQNLHAFAMENINKQKHHNQTNADMRSIC